jgi:NIMA (never in mitosis gene a)-related kinase 2
MNDKEKQQLINEVNILRELKHENIVRCYDKFVDKRNTSIFLVMECCKGGDLGKLIQKCRAPGDKPDAESNNFIQEDFIWRIFTQVVLALYECHRRKNK